MISAIFILFYFELKGESVNNTLKFLDSIFNSLNINSHILVILSKSSMIPLLIGSYNVYVVLFYKATFPNV